MKQLSWLERPGMKGRLFNSSALINCVWLGKAAKIIGEYTIEIVKLKLETMSGKDVAA